MAHDTFRAWFHKKIEENLNQRVQLPAENGFDLSDHIATPVFDGHR